MVQPDVKSNTWNDRTTFFWPLYWLKVMSPSLTEGSLKSGATSPTSPDISRPFCTKLVNSCSLVGARERLYPRTGHLTTMVIAWQCISYALVIPALPRKGNPLNVSTGHVPGHRPPPVRRIKFPVPRHRRLIHYPSLCCPLRPGQLGFTNICAGNAFSG